MPSGKKKLLVAAALLALLAVSTGSAEAATGTVSNPSFDEGWKDGKLACWHLSATKPSRLTVTRQAHSGYGAYAKGNREPGTRLYLATDRGPACRIEVSPGTAYLLKFWLRSTAGARPVVYAYSDARGWYPWFNATPIAAARLSEYSVQLPAIPAGVSAVSVGVGFDSASTVVLDDVALVSKGGQLLFQSTFPARDGLVTNEFAFWSPSDPRSLRSSVWDMTSGSLFALNGNGYSGVPDDRDMDALSQIGNRSAIFRLTTHDHSFGDVSVRMNINVHRLSSTRFTPRVDWDGVHIFLRYKTEYRLYYASVARRDGKVVIKKKCPGGDSNHGTYYELTDEAPGYPIPYGQWLRTGATVTDNSDGSVSIVLSRDGKAVVSATDRGVGCAPITGAGAIGVRGDNAEFEFGDLTVGARN